MTDTAAPNHPSKIHAPWTPEVATALNHYQKHGLGHAFTCDNPGHPPAKLVAGPAGWHRLQEGCTYTQGWAWTFMTLRGSE